MELRVLRYFLAVAREENISAAADYLHLTQPTLSRQLMDLEEELGKKLFIRGNRKITLTDDGVLLRKRASEIIELVEKTELEFRSSDEAIAGDIHIGGGESQAMRLVARTARAMQARYPGVRYHLYSGNADDVGERLDKGLLDFGIIIEPFDHKKYDSLRLLTADRWGVLMRRDSPLAQKESVTPEDLLDKPLILSQQEARGGSLIRWIGQEPEKLNIAATYNLLFNASLLVDEGLGYAVGLDKIINTTGKSSLCFRPLKPELENRMSIIWKKYQIFSKPAEKFLEVLRKSVETPEA